MARNKVRLVDIAEACNVSISTASRALREDPQIAAETRARIIAEAHSRNYKVSLAALANINVVEQKNRNGIAMACKHLAIIEHGVDIRTFFSEALVEMSRASAGIGIEATFVPVQEEKSLADCLRKARDIGPNAIILMTWNDLSEADTFLVDEADVPVVLFNRYIAGYGNAVTLDNYSAGVRMARYLYSLGHRRIAHIAGEQTAVRERAEGMRSELERLSCYDPQLFEQVQRTRFVDTINDSVQKFLGLNAPATAIWAYNDASAAIAYTAVRAAGLSVPGDVSIAGFDHMAQVRDLNLTTFDYRIAEMGRVAVNMAGDLVTGVIEGPQRICVVPTFIEGTTTGPAKR